MGRRALAVCSAHQTRSQGPILLLLLLLPLRRPLAAALLGRTLEDVATGRPHLADLLDDRLEAVDFVAPQVSARGVLSLDALAHFEDLLQLPHLRRTDEAGLDDAEQEYEEEHDEQDPL